MEKCEVKRIQRNSAQAALDKANADYSACLPMENRIAERQASAADKGSKYQKEAEQLDYMSQFLMKQLERETGAVHTLTTMKEMADDEKTRMEKEIETLRQSIRLERRRFLDSDPQTSPAAGGLYFTKVPDNQVLIAFLAAFAIFWICVSVLIIQGHIPLDYLIRTTMGERIKLISVMLVSVFVLMYIGFFAFT